MSVKRFKIDKKTIDKKILSYLSNAQLIDKLMELMKIDLSAEFYDRPQEERVKILSEEEFPKFMEKITPETKAVIDEVFRRKRMKTESDFIEGLRKLVALDHISSLSEILGGVSGVTKNKYKKKFSKRVPPL